MATSGTMSKNAAGWQFSDQITGSGDYKATLPTENKFVDANINITLTTPVAAAPILDLTNKTSALDMGTATNGVYKPSVDLAGNVNIGTAGWITAGNKEVTDSGVIVGNVNQSTMTIGAQSIASGATVAPSDSVQILTISEGYNAARTVLIGSTDTGAPAEITSGAGAAIISTPTWNSTSSKFEQTASGDVAAPIVVVSGFISPTKGTKNGNTISGNKTLDVVTVGATATGAYTVTPVLSRAANTSSNTWEDAASGAGVTIEPSSGAYVKVIAPARTSQLQLSGVVTGEGYGTAAHFTNNSSTITVGSTDADALYIPITPGEIEYPEFYVTNVEVNYDSQQDSFAITGGASLPNFIVSVPGYISENVGTIANSGVTLEDVSMPVIYLNTEIISSTPSSSTVVPTIETTNNHGNVITGSITHDIQTITSPYLISLNVVPQLINYNVMPIVSSDGYGTVDVYHRNGSAEINVSIQSQDDYFIPIAAASFANAATASVTYTDISNNVSPIPSGGYLYINEGYTSPVKISLAQLVPDASSENAPANYILSGYTAFDNDGALIVGTMQTYDGAYTVL